MVVKLLAFVKLSVLTLGGRDDGESHKCDIYKSWLRPRVSDADLKFHSININTSLV